MVTQAHILIGGAQLSHHIETFFRSIGTLNFQFGSIKPLRQALRHTHLNNLKTTLFSFFH